MVDPSSGAEHAGVRNHLQATNLAIPSMPRCDQNPAGLSEDGSNIDTMSSKTTTVDSRLGDIDDEQIAGSVYSYHSARDIAQFVQENAGRVWNTLNDVYMLPTDEDEWARLDRQHSALLMSMGDLYPCPEIVNAVLAPSPTDEKRVLDIGCGTGSWFVARTEVNLAERILYDRAIEVARRFPHASVKGVDVAPTPLDTTAFPPNLEFEIDDVNHGLVHFYDQYDFVHMRLVRSGLTDIDRTLTELQLCLKPGGLLLIVDADVAFEDEAGTKVKIAKVDGDEDVNGVSEDGSWDTRIHWEHIDACRLAGADLYHALEIIDLGFWNQTLLDPETAVSGFISLPIGPWARSGDPAMDGILKNCGTIMRHVVSNLHRTFHTPLRRFGMIQEELDEWSRRIDHELNHQLFHTLIRFPFCWARKRADDGQPAPALTGLDMADHKTKLPNHYPFLEIFYDAEEALLSRRKRFDGFVLPTSAVERAYRRLQRSQTAA